MMDIWWSSAANDALTNLLITPFYLILLIALLHRRLEWMVFIVWIYYILLCPFTKVEESFNVQAIHDILFHGSSIEDYDHLEFPGVVPRTFIGPLVVASISWPFVMLARSLGLTKLYVLIIARAVLAVLVFLCFRRLVISVRRSFGPKVAFWLCLLTAFQFHFNFYASRPLPNVFALSLALLSFSYWINGEYNAAIWPAVTSAFIFRSELVLLYAPMFLPLLLTGRISFISAVVHGVGAVALSLGTTVPLDSWFWRRWLWPEGEVWYYNVVLNKSSDWGTSPMLWYFYSVLPRALLLSLPLAPIGAYFHSRIRMILAVGLIFVCVYSLLPHKELRFIIYVFPLFNLASAVACDRIFENGKKSRIWRLFSIGIVGHIVLNGYASSMFARAAYGNYPGADALMNLNSMENGTDRVRLHIDVFCAQTGISRFLHEHEKWEYNKSENLMEGSAALLAFDYILAGSDDAQELERITNTYGDSHAVVKDVEGFQRMALSIIHPQWPFLKTVEPIWTRRAVVLKKLRGGVFRVIGN